MSFFSEIYAWFDFYVIEPIILAIPEKIDLYCLFGCLDRWRV